MGFVVIAHGAGIDAIQVDVTTNLRGFVREQVQADLVLVTAI